VLFPKEVADYYCSLASDCSCLRTFDPSTSASPQSIAACSSRMCPLSSEIAPRTFISEATASVLSRSSYHLPLSYLGPLRSPDRRCTTPIRSADPVLLSPFASMPASGHVAADNRAFAVSPGLSSD
jgi:hypothetical protein